jgi:acyl-CoA synthetase (NDP forming)
MGVDLAIIAGSAERMEGQIAAVLARGARSLYALAGAHDPALRARVAAMAKEAGAPLLGPNSIGYVNFARRRAATWTPPPRDMRAAGSIFAVIQSGSTYAYMHGLDPRLRFSMNVHPGQEADVTTADLMAYGLSLPETRVIGIYLEVVRDPAGFVEMADEADRRGIPVVVVRPGRSDKARAAVATHAGRLAGSDAAFDALCRRHRVVRTGSMDEFLAALTLFSSARPPASGGLAVVTDSGGQRSMLLDEAEAIGLPLAGFGAATRARLDTILAPELERANPIDMWAGEEDLPGHVARCLDAAAGDPDTAAAAFMTEIGANDTDAWPSRVADGLRRAADGTDKPILGLTFSARQFFPEHTIALDRAGIPVLDGMGPGLRAIRDWLSWHRRTPRVGPAMSPEIAGLAPLIEAARGGGEAEALAALAAAGIPVIAHRRAASEVETCAAARVLGYPVALKTDEGHLHKTELGGVALGLADEAALSAAYRAMASRLGPRVLVAAMAPKGVEIALGVVPGDEYGPLVMAAAGGTLVEVLDDKVFELAPVDERTADSMIGRLKVARLLAGVRGRGPVDRAALVRALSRLSLLAAAHSGLIAEIDVNPIVVHAGGAVAVDAVLRLR